MFLDKTYLILIALISSKYLIHFSIIKYVLYVLLIYLIIFKDKVIKPKKTQSLVKRTFV